MTDKEKIRAEIERLMNYFDSEYDDDTTDVKAAKGNVCHEILSFIDSMQEEPQELVLKQLKKLGWNMYHAYQYLTTDASHVRKAMKEWYNYINFELNKQEEPSISDIVDEYWWKMLDPNIMYASREKGIKALAEDYSFNVESELFQQLTKEQQGLWRKEIEQACIHGGYGGLNLANDKRYDQEEPVSEKDKLMALSDGKQHLGWLDDANLIEAYQRYADRQIERVYPDLSPNLPRKSRMTLNVFDGTELELAFEAGANWQKQRMIEKACKWLALRTGLDDMKVEMFRKDMEE